MKNKQITNKNTTNKVVNKTRKADPNHVNNAITVPSYSVSRINNSNKNTISGSNKNMTTTTTSTTNNSIPSSISDNSTIQIKSVQNENSDSTKNTNTTSNHSSTNNSSSSSSSSNSSSSLNTSTKKSKKQNNSDNSSSNQTSINIEKVSNRRNDKNINSSKTSNNTLSKSNSNSKSNTLRNFMLTVMFTCLIAVVFVTSNNSKLLSSITGNNYQQNARYIRSVSQNNNPSNQDNNNNPNENNQINDILTKVINGVTEMYNNHFSQSIQNIIGSSSDLRQADLSSLSKNGKLHYVPSSGFDPSKTAHHVLEGAGYRLNIPSYVQNVPEQENNNNNMDNNDQESNNQKDLQDQIDSSKQNEEFDLAITNKQMPTRGARPGMFDQNSVQMNQNTNSQNQQNPNTIIKQSSITTSNTQIDYNKEVPLSKIDPELDTIINDMLELRKIKQSSTGSQVQSVDSSNNFNIIKNLNTTEIFNQNSDNGQCQPKKDIVFAKTHKTGGTTITNMLLRHAERQKLNVALPVEYHWELAGYPAEYNSDLITPKQDNYNVMCHHMRFNKKEIEKQVSPLADYFTILRDPVSNFESSFGFFKDYPFTSWLDENRSLDDFVNNAEQYYNKSTPWYFRAKNYMSFDLGFDHENNSKDYIKHAISKMEEDFKFVMITDRYEESMILLKNMLCLDYDDIIYLPLKVRTEDDRKKISAETAAKIKKWNRLDTAIYEYFSNRFEQMTVEYGKEKLAKEVEILKEKLKDVETRCVEDYDSQSLKPWIKRIKLRKPSGQMCQRLVWGEVKYADYLRQSQYSQLSEEDYNNQPKLDDKIQLMQEVQQEVLGDLSV